MAGKNCPVWVAWITLIAGILYLLADLGVWVGWGSINWWTIAFILAGLSWVSNK